MRTSVASMFNTRSVVFLCIGSLAAISLAWLPAFGFDDVTSATSPKTLSDVKDMLDLASSLVKSKDAENKIAEAQVKLLRERRKLLVAEVKTADVSVATAEKERNRIKVLAANKKLPELQEKLATTEAAFNAAKALAEEANAKVPIGDAEIDLAIAKHDLAKAVLADVKLRHEHLKSRAKASADSPNKAVNPSGETNTIK